MENQKLLEVARGSIEAFNQRDWNRFRELTAPNAVYDEVGTGRKLTGRDEILQTMQGWTKAFPDIEGTMNSSLASDDRVVLEVTFEGTHDGDLATPTGTISPTGNHVTERVVQVCRISDGHIVETRNYFDMLHMLQAVDALPTQAARRAGA